MIYLLQNYLKKFHLINYSSYSSYSFKTFQSILVLKQRVVFQVFFYDLTFKKKNNRRFDLIIVYNVLSEYLQPLYKNLFQLSWIWIGHVFMITIIIFIILLSRLCFTWFFKYLFSPAILHVLSHTIKKSNNEINRTIMF